MLELLGYIASVLIGLSLGLIGGGGSILTVPVLVYLFGVAPVLATGYSLFVVGVVALSGSFTFMRKRQVNLSAAIFFVLPSLCSVFLTRSFIIPSVPEHIVTVADVELDKDMAVMIFFTLVMLAASIKMLWPKGDEVPVEKAEVSKVKMGLIGLVIGLVTGLAGAGGGFLIVPALVLFAKLPMKTAVGTSLVIIAVNSLIGFIGDIGYQEIDWPFLTVFTALPIIGIFIGSWLSRYIQAAHLKKAFGWFVLAMAIVIFITEINSN